MKIHITLYSTLRDILPKEARGRAEIELPEEATLADLRYQLGLADAVICSVNGQVERNIDRTLKDGDNIQAFRAAGGGC